MKNCFFTLLLLIPFVSFSQSKVLITGKVVTGEIPLEGASVYLNNSLRGTTTDREGKFGFYIEEGSFELIVSHIGYHAIKYVLIPQNVKAPLRFQMTEKEDKLEEIVVRSNKTNKASRNPLQWRERLNIFKAAFLGKNGLAKTCKILNKESIYFDFEPQTKTLQAFAEEPIKIRHKGLGYFISFDLLEFKMSPALTTYAGYSRYKYLNASKRQQRRWKKRRKEVYNGSVKHFFSSLITKNLKKNGFVVHEFKLVKNTQRPSESDIKKALAFAKDKNIIIDASEPIINLQTKLDTVLFIVQQSKLPKFKRIRVNQNLSEKDIFTKENDFFKLVFDHNLEVIYTKEGEQVSFIIPQEKPIYLNHKGNLVNPLSVNLEGYWTFEKFAYALPIDYKLGE